MAALANARPWMAGQDDPKSMRSRQDDNRKSGEATSPCRRRLRWERPAMDGRHDHPKPMKIAPGTAARENRSGVTCPRRLRPAKKVRRKGP
jgi:hypothetical protein